jgi:hypothetical protein
MSLIGFDVGHSEAKSRKLLYPASILDSTSLTTADADSKSTSYKSSNANGKDQVTNKTKSTTSSPSPPSSSSGDSLGGGNGTKNQQKLAPKRSAGGGGWRVWDYPPDTCQRPGGCNSANKNNTTSSITTMDQKIGKLMAHGRVPEGLRYRCNVCYFVHLCHNAPK